MIAAARDQGKGINEYMGWRGPATWRQHEAWLAFLRPDEDEPRETSEGWELTDEEFQAQVAQAKARWAKRGGDGRGSRA